MNSISNDVLRHTVTAAQIIGTGRVRDILRLHFANEAGSLKLRYVDGFLRDLKRAVDEALLRKQNCKPCEAPEAQQCGAPAPQPSEVDFEPLYAAVMEAEEVIGREAVRETLYPVSGVSVPSLLRVQDVNRTIAALREAVAAATPTRKLLKEYIESGECPYSEPPLRAFADWIDSRKPTSTAPADEADSEWVNRYHK